MAGEAAATGPIASIREANSPLNSRPCLLVCWLLIEKFLIVVLYFQEYCLHYSFVRLILSKFIEGNFYF